MDGTVKSAARTLGAFAYFAERQGPATVSEVAAALDMPVSSASILLKSLLRLGYLERLPRSREYMPTLRFALLGAWLLESLTSEAEPAGQMMDALRARTQETVVLAAEQAPDVAYVRILESIAPVRFHLKSGIRRPLWLTAAGQAILTTWPDARIERLLADARDAGARPPDIDRFLAEIARIRAAGYAMTEGAATPDGAMIAVAFPSSAGRALALAVCGPLERMRRKEAAIVEVMAGMIREVAPRR